MLYDDDAIIWREVGYVEIGGVRLNRSENYVLSRVAKGECRLLLMKRSMKPT